MPRSLRSPLPQMSWPHTREDQHLGESSPLQRSSTWALRDVAPADKAAFGKLVGQARSPAR
jgi:hypothetical protein